MLSAKIPSRGTYDILLVWRGTTYPTGVTVSPENKVAKFKGGDAVDTRVVYVPNDPVSGDQETGAMSLADDRVNVIGNCTDVRVESGTIHVFLSGTCEKPGPRI